MEIGADHVQPTRIQHRLALGLECLVERCLHRLIRLTQRVDRRALVDDGGRCGHRQRLVDSLERGRRQLGVDSSLLGGESADGRIDKLRVSRANAARVKAVDERDGGAEGVAETSAQQQPRHVSRVATEENVGTTACHVGGDRDGAGTARLRKECRRE